MHSDPLGCYRAPPDPIVGLNRPGELDRGGNERKRGERETRGRERERAVSHAWKIMLATLHDSSIEELTVQRLVNRKYYIVKQYKIPYTVFNTIHRGP